MYFTRSNSNTAVVLTIDGSECANINPATLDVSGGIIYGIPAGSVITTSGAIVGHASNRFVNFIPYKDN